MNLFADPILCVCKINVEHNGIAFPRHDIWFYLLRKVDDQADLLVKKSDLAKLVYEPITSGL